MSWPLYKDRPNVATHTSSACLLIGPLVHTQAESVHQNSVLGKVVFHSTTSSIYLFIFIFFYFFFFFFLVSVDCRGNFIKHCPYGGRSV